MNNTRLLTDSMSNVPLTSEEFSMFQKCMGIGDSDVSNQLINTFNNVLVQIVDKYENCIADIYTKQNDRDQKFLDALEKIQDNHEKTIRSITAGSTTSDNNNDPLFYSTKTQSQCRSWSRFANDLVSSLCRETGLCHYDAYNAIYKEMEKRHGYNITDIKKRYVNKHGNTSKVVVCSNSDALRNSFEMCVEIVKNNCKKKTNKVSSADVLKKPIEFINIVSKAYPSVKTDRGTTASKVIRMFQKNYEIDINQLKDNVRKKYGYKNVGAAYAIMSDPDAVKKFKSMVDGIVANSK